VDSHWSRRGGHRGRNHHRRGRDERWVKQSHPIDVHDDPADQHDPFPEDHDGDQSTQYDIGTNDHSDHIHPHNDSGDPDSHDYPGDIDAHDHGATTNDVS
jgi:hypothetical protein